MYTYSVYSPATRFSLAKNFNTSSIGIRSVRSVNLTSSIYGYQITEYEYTKNFVSDYRMIQSEIYYRNSICSFPAVENKQVICILYIHKYRCHKNMIPSSVVAIHHVITIMFFFVCNELECTFSFTHLLHAHTHTDTSHIHENAFYLSKVPATNYNNQNHNYTHSLTHLPDIIN